MLPRILVQPVLTAHPTEAKRAAILERHREIYLLLVERENPTRTPMEQAALAAADPGDHRMLVANRARTCSTRPDVDSEIRGTLHYMANVFPGVLQLMSERFEQSWEWAFPGSVPPVPPKLTFRHLGGRRPRRPSICHHGGDPRRAGIAYVSRPSQFCASNSEILPPVSASPMPCNPRRLARKTFLLPMVFGAWALGIIMGAVWTAVLVYKIELEDQALASRRLASSRQET